MGGILRQWANVAAAAVTIGVNALANALPINGQTTGAISDRFPVYFVPAGYAFSIWGLIYVGVVAFVAYQALPLNRESPSLRQLDLPFLVSCAANSIWIFLWHYEQFGWTVVAMVVLLVALVTIYRKLQSTRGLDSGAARWAVRAPFSVYLGWITVATVANVTVYLYQVGWDGWGIAPQTWAAVMLVVAGVIASAVSLPRADVAYMLVILWAFAGIAVKQAASPLVAWTAVAAAIVLAAAMLVRVFSLASRRRTVSAGAAQ